MNTCIIEGVDIRADEIAEILDAHYTNRSVKVVQAPQLRNGVADRGDVLVADLPMRAKDIMELEDALDEAETAKRKAVDSANGFQKQHQATYDKFLSLRKQFDEQKASLLKTLWVHCGAWHPDLREIPVLETSAKFVESEEEVGEYEVGDVLGQGQFATVKSCHRKGDRYERTAPCRRTIMVRTP
jgi:hypothetical protein